MTNEEMKALLFSLVPHRLEDVDHQRIEGLQSVRGGCVQTDANYRLVNDTKGVFGLGVGLILLKHDGRLSVTKVNV